MHNDSVVSSSMIPYLNISKHTFSWNNIWNIKIAFMEKKIQTNSCFCVLGDFNFWQDFHSATDCLQPLIMLNLFSWPKDLGWILFFFLLCFLFFSILIYFICFEFFSILGSISGYLLVAYTVKLCVFLGQSIMQ